jgi:hypothetical protein
MGNINTLGHRLYAVRKNSESSRFIRVPNYSLFQIAIVELRFCKDQGIKPIIVKERISYADLGKGGAHQVLTVM